MTFLAPGFFFASLAVAAGVIALHFIVTRQPRAEILPTARFVPNLPATATARHTRPSDILLMLLRVLLVLAAGAGMARPIFKPSRGAEARVILADVSRSVRDSLALRDSVRSLYRDHDALIVFDSSARQVTLASKDSIATFRPSSRQGNIGAAMIAAQRAASALRDRADSIELVIVSAFAAEEFDDATSAIRNLWPGKARLVRIEPARDSATTQTSLDVRAAQSDPLLVAAGFAKRSPDVRALIIRDGSNVQSTDRPVLEWPAAARPRGAVARAKPDVIGGIVAGREVVVASFARKWSYPADSISGATVIARWIDGEPAAIEWQSGSSCVRSAAIPVAATGDLVLRDDFARLVAALSTECVAQAALKGADAAAVDRLAGRGGLASRDSFLPRQDVRSSIAPWLIALAFALAIIELFVRRRVSAARAEARVRAMDRAA
jgi:hypothetical protein